MAAQKPFDLVPGMVYRWGNG